MSSTIACKCTHKFNRVIVYTPVLKLPILMYCVLTNMVSCSVYVTGSVFNGLHLCGIVNTNQIVQAIMYQLNLRYQLKIRNTCQYFNVSTKAKPSIYF